MISKLLACASLALVLVVPSRAQTEARTVTFSGVEWSLRGDVTVGRHLGREALRFRNGAASLDGVEFTDGTIEFDVATTGERSFVGVAFRIQESRIDYENFYLRPHQSGRFDAMQYTPVRNGLAAWQLYPEHNSSYEIPRDEWLHVRLEIDDAYMEVYLGDATEPVQVVDNLRLPASNGGVSLLAYFPANQPEDHYPTAYSNVVVRTPSEGIPASRRRPPTVAGEPGGVVSHPTGLIEAWSLSPAVKLVHLRVTSLPALQGDWTVAETDRLGRLNIAEHRAFPEGADWATALARVTVRSDRARSVRLDFGFSDRGSIFLNGELLFVGNRTYRSRSLRYLGVMTIHGDTLMLPLREGDNELVFAVTEEFGGWGLMAALPDREGLHVSAR